MWHQLNLHSIDTKTSQPNGYYNFICEIPKFTRKKFEISTDEPFNPIKQDTKNGALRSFSKGDIFFNYGCFPRTWEDPNFVHPALTVGGDNDPLDVCEIGLRQIKVGDVREVKILGVLCLIDDGEADWKVIAIDAEDRWASELNDIEDVSRLLPGTLEAVYEWFRTYKMTDGKPENKFGFNGEYQNAAFTKEIIRETHIAWKELCLKAKKNSQNNSILKLSVPNFEELDYDTDNLALQACSYTSNSSHTDSVSTVGESFKKTDQNQNLDEENSEEDEVGILF